MLAASQSLSPQAFIKRVGLLVALTAVAVSTLTLAVDPYGISPITPAIERFNMIKSARRDIDRLTKPIDVLQQKPRTIFMGTSRIHQSMRPEVLDETPLAPAYNAAIPAATLSENLAFIRQFAATDSNLRYVILETYFYDFLRDQAAPDEIRPPNLPQSYLEMLFSLSAVRDATRTLYRNLRNKPDFYVTKGGYFVYPPGFDGRGNFNEPLYINSVLPANLAPPRPAVAPSASAILAQIAQFCSERGITLIIITGPNYIWDEYRILRSGLWPALEDQYRVLSNYPEAYSFTVSSTVNTEPTDKPMRYWNDPIHFTDRVGQLMLNAIATRFAAEAKPALEPIKLDLVPAMMERRRQHIEDWAAQNRRFIDAFDNRLSVVRSPL